jgi:hypothetical protein
VINAQQSREFTDGQVRVIGPNETRNHRDPRALDGWTYAGF